MRPEIASAQRGFGLVAAFDDPEGNPFEVVELKYEFGGGGERA